MNISPRFYLKRPTSTTPTGIQLVLRFNKQLLKYGTGKSILPDLWDTEAQRPTTNRYQIKKLQVDKVDLENIKIALDNFEVEVKRIAQYLERQKVIPTVEIIRKELDVAYENERPSKKANHFLIGYVEKSIDEMEKGEKLVQFTGKRFTKGTIKNVKGFLSQLKEYQKKKRKKLRFEDITTDFYDSFVQFFNGKNYSPNTIGRHIKNLKTTMRSARDEGLHTNNEFERKQFKTLKVDSPSIYLTEKELSQIEALDLSGNEVLQSSKDVFLVGCYTAQRFSDYSRIAEGHIQSTSRGNQIVKLIQKKTGIEVQIPVSPKLKAILEKYDYQLPKLYEQKLNMRIKEVGKLAGIDTQELIEEIRGGLKVKKQILKYELIKTHTARRTGATNMYLAGIAPIDIMKITGHQTEKNLLKYIKVTKEETADILANHSYFNQSPLKIAK